MNSELTPSPIAKSEDEKPHHQHFPCDQCGAKLEYKVGSAHQECSYCGARNEIPQSAEDINEIDLEAFLRKELRTEETEEVIESQCQQCGARSSTESNVTSRECPFCGSSIVSQAQSVKQVKPKSLLPFKVTATDSHQLFYKWVTSLWFAPNDLKKIARIGTKLKGMYVPYWTYDSQTTSHYSGQRGDYYYTSETYRDSSGNTKTRQVRHTRWTPASGIVLKGFDDVLVIASNSLPRATTRKLEPWDLQNLTPYQSEYLSGFSAESYALSVDKGFGFAKERMKNVIVGLVQRDIGGDTQRIHSLKTQHDRVTFKHILLPIWISSYRYRKKVYRFVVNGRTGEVQGDRPWSWIKITFAILLVLLILVAGGYAQMRLER